MFLFDPMDCSQTGSSVHGILQARILERVVISFSRGSSQPRDQTYRALLHSMLGRVRGNCGTTAPLSNGGGGQLGEELFTGRINLSSISYLFFTAGKDIPRCRSAPIL